MAKISAIDIPSLNFEELASDPTTPASGFWRLYAKADGFYIIDDAGATTGPLEVVVVVADPGDLIEVDTQTVTGSDGTITFSSIPATYRDLIIVAMLRDDGSTPSGLGNCRVRLGATSVDTGSNYQSGGKVLRSNETASLDVEETSATSWMGARDIANNNSDAGYFTPVELTIYRYTDSSKPRTMRSQAVGFRGDSFEVRDGVMAGVWQNTADVPDIIQILGDSLGNLKVGSTATLYGRGTA